MKPGPVNAEQLIAHAEGSLSEADARAVEAALAADPQAARTVAMYRLCRSTLANDDTVPASPRAIERARSQFRPLKAARNFAWLESLDRLVATLLFDSRVTPLAVRYADSHDQVQWTFEAGEAEIDVQAQRFVNAAGQDRWRIMGQVAGKNAALRSGKAALAAIGPGGLAEPISETDSDEQGGFSFEAPAGRYRFLLQVGQLVIETPDLVVQ